MAGHNPQSQMFPQLITIEIGTYHHGKTQLMAFRDDFPHWIEDCPIGVFPQVHSPGLQYQGTTASSLVHTTGAWNPSVPSRRLPHQPPITNIPRLKPI